MAEKKQYPRVLVPITDGTEDIEAVTVIDILRRTQEVDLVVATVGKNQITAARQTKIVGDKSIDDVLSENIFFVMLPRGPGASKLYESKELKKLLDAQVDNGGLLAAICAAPAVVLAQHGFLKNVECTCYPSDKFSEIMRKNDAKLLEKERVVVRRTGGSDGKRTVVITSQGPATALDFSLTIVEVLWGKDKAGEIAKATLHPWKPIVV
ncbi:hypothetical protein RFI_03708 [Reticulomyxa filosa]|uniref:DJ-1/PfpI domain-containing protein n=1 Tax=Reticulomyxa filosa TaxID=46433 RepID=X6P5P8_RETFI|nr:hypothetical protein RFI_03708 [Reticulomyxa filosa]|eukprot:ETO33399.1 hypothetical protein RFI_03708 [Reticulomyxa filosa]